MLCSVAYIMSMSGTEWQLKEKRREEADHDPDQTTACLGHGVGAGAASDASGAGGTRGHTTANTKGDTVGGHARAESIRLLAVRGLVCGSGTESALARRLLHCRLGRGLCGGT